jgi:4-amino-4-deoxy-L-arabinose transferase-like glycosyltransferase
VRKQFIVLVAIAVLTFFVGLGSPSIADSDEAFYAESSREMVESGDWLTPHFNYVYRFEKPVLYYWLAGLSYVTLGVSEMAALFSSPWPHGLVSGSGAIHRYPLDRTKTDQVIGTSGFSQPAWEWLAAF